MVDSQEVPFVSPEYAPRLGLETGLYVGSRNWTAAKALTELSASNMRLGVMMEMRRTLGMPDRGTQHSYWGHERLPPPVLSMADFTHGTYVEVVDEGLDMLFNTPFTSIKETDMLEKMRSTPGSEDAQPARSVAHRVISRARDPAERLLVTTIVVGRVRQRSLLTPDEDGDRGVGYRVDLEWQRNLLYKPKPRTF